MQADQLVNEKLTGADNTKLDDDFVQMEQITEAYIQLEVGLVFCWLIKKFIIKQSSKISLKLKRIFDEIKPKQYLLSILSSCHFPGRDGREDEGLSLPQPRRPGQDDFRQRNRNDRGGFTIYLYIHYTYIHF